tara:strand:- start:272 stop:487 length:216 start_codon:yes stop_codon:yes gene_type:complete
MKRLELIEQLEKIQYNIEMIERQLNQKIEDTTYYILFGDGPKSFEHDKEIRTKAYAFWIRKFNRTLNLLKY